MSNREKYNPMELYISRPGIPRGSPTYMQDSPYVCKRCDESFEDHVDGKCLFGSSSFVPNVIRTSASLLERASNMIHSQIGGVNAEIHRTSSRLGEIQRGVLRLHVSACSEDEGVDESLVLLKVYDPHE